MRHNVIPIFAYDIMALLCCFPIFISAVYLISEIPSDSMGRWDRATESPVAALGFGNRVYVMDVRIVVG